MAPKPKDRAAVMAAVCERIVYENALIEDAARAEGTTGKTVRQWAAEDDALGAIYARARELSAETLELEAIQTARGSTAETAPSDRLLVDTLKWAASKRRPKVYGDKVDLTTDGEKLAPSQTVVIGGRIIAF